LDSDNDVNWLKGPEVIELIKKIQSRFFEYVYQTDLDIATCRERLTNEYLQKVRKEKSDLLLTKKRWWHFHFKRPKGEVQKIRVTLTKYDYTFRTKLFSRGHGTFILLQYSSPFGSILVLSFLFYVAFTAFLAVGFHTSSDDYGAIHGILISSFLYFIVGSPLHISSYLNSSTAHEIVENYLKIALEAKITFDSEISWSQSTCIQAKTGNDMSRENKKADNRTINGVLLKRMTFFNEKAEVFIPDSLSIMTEEMLKLKYPSGSRPSIAYTDELGSVSLTFNHTRSKINEDDFPAFFDTVKSAFATQYPTIQFYRSEIQTADENSFVIFEMIIPADETDIYSLMWYVILDGYMLVASFECMTSQVDNWRDIAHFILDSFELR